MNLTTLAEFTQFGRLFPLKQGTKIPLTGWSKRSIKGSDDIKILDKWLERYPDCNWALVPVRAFVVDVDCKNEALGMESIESACGEFDVSFTVRTPSGGYHRYFAPDPSVPFKTSNNWMSGVDIRYGDGGYIVLPYSNTVATPDGKTVDGTYRIEIDLEELSSGASHRPADEHKSSLTPIPDWIKSKLLEPEPEPLKKSLSKDSLLHHVLCTVSDVSWTEVRSSIRYRFFRSRQNARIWNHVPLETMKDRSQSGFEWYLATKLMSVGATDSEVLTFYRVWCSKHKLRFKKRFQKYIMPKARIETDLYIAQWQARQPVRRKHGTTKSMILDAIRNGTVRPMDIIKVLRLKDSTIRMHIKRMTAAGVLRRTAEGYAIAGDSRPVAESEAA